MPISARLCVHHDFGTHCLIECLYKKHFGFRRFCANIGWMLARATHRRWHHANFSKTDEERQYLTFVERLVRYYRGAPYTRDMFHMKCFCARSFVAILFGTVRRIPARTVDVDVDLLLLYCWQQRKGPEASSLTDETTNRDDPRIQCKVWAITIEGEIVSRTSYEFN